MYVCGVVMDIVCTVCAQYHHRYVCLYIVGGVLWVHQQVYVLLEGNVMVMYCGRCIVGEVLWRTLFTLRHVYVLLGGVVAVRCG